MKSVTVVKEIDLDIDVSDFGDDELIDELRERGYGVSDYGDSDAALTAYHSLHGLLDYLPEPARQFILDAAGRVA